MNRTTTNRRARDCLLLSEAGFTGFRDLQDRERAMNRTTTNDSLKDSHTPVRFSNLDGSNLLLLGFSPFRSRRFQRRVRGDPDRTLRRGCR